MSQFYKESNTESAFELFNKKVVYQYNTLNAQYPNLVDFRAEKLLYGRVNRVFTPIVIPRNSTSLKRFAGKSNNDAKALNFVVDAFTDLQRQFDKCRSTNKIATDDPYLSSLKVYKAYIDPYSYYDQYSNNLKSSFSNLSQLNQNNIKSFDKMVDGLQSVMDTSGKINPLTFPGFIKSRKSPINISGLVVEIADLDASNDNDKINNFRNSRNWQFYLNTCKTYGFMVDLEVPWRLVADIGSQPMIEYASRYNSNNTNQILTNYYQTAHYSYFNSFTDSMLSLYNNLKPNIIIENEDCNGRTKTKTYKPEEFASSAKLKDNLGDDRIIEIYCKFRFSEEENLYNQEQMNTLIRDTIQISKIQNPSAAISNFENLINKTFDYQGSLGYYIRQEQARSDSVS